MVKYVSKLWKRVNKEKKTHLFGNRKLWFECSRRRLDIFLSYFFHFPYNFQNWLQFGTVKNLSRCRHEGYWSVQVILLSAWNAANWIQQYKCICISAKTSFNNSIYCWKPEITGLHLSEWTESLCFHLSAASPSHFLLFFSFLSPVDLVLSAQCLLFLTSTRAVRSFLKKKNSSRASRPDSTRLFCVRAHGMLGQRFDLSSTLTYTTMSVLHHERASIRPASLQATNWLMTGAQTHRVKLNRIESSVIYCVPPPESFQCCAWVRSAPCTCTCAILIWNI